MLLIIIYKFDHLFTFSDRFFKLNPQSLIFASVLPFFVQVPIVFICFIFLFLKCYDPNVYTVLCFLKEGSRFKPERFYVLLYSFCHLFYILFFLS